MMKEEGKSGLFWIAVWTEESVAKRINGFCFFVLNGDIYFALGKGRVEPEKVNELGSAGN